MRIAVIGAAGNVGSRVVAEALRRGHRVTPLTADDVVATDPGTVADPTAGHAVGVRAPRPVPGGRLRAGGGVVHVNVPGLFGELWEKSATI